MGLEDRDYMRERRRRELGRESPFRPPPQRSILVPLLFWVAIAAAGFKIAQHWESIRPARATKAPFSLQVEQASAVQKPAEVRPRSSARTEAPPVPQPSPATYTVPAQVDPAPAAPRVSNTGNTIYHCKDYGGGTFWSQAHCSQHRALIDRIASVPAGLPFHQQVEIAEHGRQAALARAQQGQRAYAPSPEPAVATQATCKHLDARVEQLDAMARQPQSASTQDWIRSERQKTRDAQFRLRC